MVILSSLDPFISVMDVFDFCISIFKCGHAGGSKRAPAWWISESSSVHEERHPAAASERKTNKIANMQWSPLVLILMAQCSLCMCCLYKYHFVQQKKSWEEARKYCRENYTDLATVMDASDMVTLDALAGNQSDAWIGLRNEGVSKRWHWSLPGLEFNDSEAGWDVGEPNNYGGDENCVMVRPNYKWNDAPCSWQSRFICYNEKKNKTFHFIDEKKTWQEAQSYCREKHTDLASGLTQLHDEAVKDWIKNKTQYVWIGVFADTWRWSDGSNFSHWDPKQYEGEVNKTCATVSGRTWSTDECNKKKPFFCYNDEVILINKSMTWENALTYCRENHRDLVSITDARQQRWVQERAKKANTTHVWIGLHNFCTVDLWWIIDEVVHYKKWKPNPEMEDCDKSGAMETGGQHQWSKENANMKFNFICLKR